MLSRHNKTLNAFSFSQKEEFNKADVKTLTKELCQAYKNGSISEKTFHVIIEHLLVIFFESSFDDKLLSKICHLDDKLTRTN